MNQILDGKSIVLGTCYYPEHWEREDWEPDLKRMLEHGIRVIRIAEFAWNKVEPEEGVYTYDFWDEFLDTAERCGMKVIFCTPTATAPAWMTEKYPEVMNADIDGLLYRHGNRQQTNLNSPKYRGFSRIITEKLASHYAKHPAIIGWQLDNEFNCSLNVYYSESDTLAFREFLKERYDGSIDALNKAWGTVFWNQTYNSFDQIHVPRKVPSASPNPHMMLDYYRFISESVIRFAAEQAEIIRRYKKPGDFVTTNGIFGHLDNHRLVGDVLDFITYDSYPNFAYVINGSGLKGLRDRKWSRNLSEVRSISPVFGIMEQQSGANGWNTNMEACAPRPGQMTLWSMQSIAHGADYVSYFRWRTSTIGTEIYWHGLLDYSGRENRRMRELSAFHAKLNRLQEVAGTRYAAKAGVLQDYDNQWDSEIDVWHEHVEHASREGIFTAAQHLHTPLDYVDLRDNTPLEKLAKYDVLFYPHAVILTKERAELLEAYVAQGGKLVMGCRAGYKDRTGRCVREDLPGLAAKLTGTDVPEFTFIAPDEPEVSADWDGAELTASVFTDMLALKDGDPEAGEDSAAEVLAWYKSGVFAGEPALLRNRFGSGEAYYYGSTFTEEAARVFLTKLGAAEPYRGCVELPEGVELAVRAGEDGREYLFLLNYDKDPAMITVKAPMQNLFEEGTPVWQGEMELPGYGTAVLKM